MQHFSAFLQNNAELAQLSDKVKRLSATRDLWDTVIPETLKPYTQAVDVDHKQLTVYAGNAAAAAKIKLLLPSLLTKLQKHGLEVTSIRVRVQVQSDPPAPAKIQRNLSTCAAGELGKLAKQIDNNPALSSALRKLAGRAAN